MASGAAHGGESAHPDEDREGLLRPAGKSPAFAFSFFFTFIRELVGSPLSAASCCRRSLGSGIVARRHTEFLTEQSHLGVVHAAFYELPGILFSPAQQKTMGNAGTVVILSHDVAARVVPDG